MSTLAELFVHNDWGRDKLLTLAAELNNEQLDRPFKVGPGSLRATLQHLYGAERLWFDRWEGATESRFPRSSMLNTIPELTKSWHALAAARNGLVLSRDAVSLRDDVTYANLDGQAHTFPLGELMLHVCNHGAHHRAQVLYMFRQVGVEKRPGLDYLFMRLERPTLEVDADAREQWRARGFSIAETPEKPGTLDFDTIRQYYRYSDWANERVFGIAAELGDDALDRDLGIGIGRLRKTLLHIRDAEEWWCNYWSGREQEDYELPESTSIAELIERASATAERRNRFLRECDADELGRPISVAPAPGMKLTFRLGESMLQLPTHGTHHRAQAVNMFRQLGAAVPELDYVMWLHETA